MEKKYIEILNNETNMYLDRIDLYGESYAVFAEKDLLKNNRLNIRILRYIDDVIKIRKTTKSDQDDDIFFEEYTLEYDPYIIDKVIELFKCKWKYFLKPKMISLKLKNIGIVEFKILDIVEFENKRYMFLEILNSKMKKEKEFLNFNNEIKKFTYLFFDGEVEDNDLEFYIIEDEELETIIFKGIQKKWKYTYDFFQHELFVFQNNNIKILDFKTILEK